MPWQAVSVMSLREEFVNLAKQMTVSFSELCRRFQISRKTGYKWIGRYESQGPPGLADQSRRPHRIVFRVPPLIEEKIVDIRRRHQAWGARKIRKRLRAAGLEQIPACSTITQVLHRRGLIPPESPGGQQDWQRFESPMPNDLCQMIDKNSLWGSLNIQKRELKHIRRRYVDGLKDGW